MAQDKKITLLDKAKDTLELLSPDLSRTDKREAAKELGFHKETINRYLSGDVRDLDTATSLIQFFKKRISQNEKKIAA